jgi:hypothetical protein
MSVLKKLTSLRLQSNQLASTVPASLGLLSNLNDLKLECNSFSGVLPALPFDHYLAGHCFIGGGVKNPDCDAGSERNNFRCPLPPHAAEGCYVACTEYISEGLYTGENEKAGVSVEINVHAGEAKLDLL